MNKQQFDEVFDDIVFRVQDFTDAQVCKLVELLQSELESRDVHLHHEVSELDDWDECL